MAANNSTPPNDNPMAKPTVGSLCELMILDHRYDKNGKLTVVPKRDNPEAKAASAFSEHALVHRRIFNVKQELVSTKVEINSPFILRVLSEIVKYYPAHPEQFTESLTIESPFKLLYHHWQELADYRKNADDETIMHLRFLLAFMDSELQDDKKKAERLVAAGHISFSLLWTIFRPGSLVLRGDKPENSQLFRLEQTEYEQDSEGRYLSLTTSRTNYDGIDTGREGEIIELRESNIGRAQVITRLDAYPLTFAKDQEGMIDRMTKRGEHFMALRGIHVRRYRGQLQLLHKPPLEFFSPERKHYAGTFNPHTIQGRIIVDTKTFIEESPYYDPYLFEDELQAEEETPNGSMTSHIIRFWPSNDPMLCPPWVLGFCPSLKQWGRFYIDRIEDANWNPNSFDTLILPDEPKRVIRCLVSSHQYPNDGARDQQDLKGKGLVVLLHGSPGTGKTLTAESVSEYTKRVLIVISSGELGSTVSHIDQNLRMFLQYAALWKAIVLIDESDVFLEARLTGVSNRLEQNSLVAVFLRHLEYFQGIIFLTSNRGSGFDPAIKSRIHLLLQFAPPDHVTRRALWSQMLQRLSPDEFDIDLEDALRIVQHAKMNGREIANAVNTIRTLAREEQKKISEEHFVMFLEVWECFDNVQQVGKGTIGKGGKEMRNTEVKQVCSECGCNCKEVATMLVRRGSLL